MSRPDDVCCEVLPGGLTALLREAHLAPVVELQVWAGVGSADERPSEAGLAHFHEHMLFKGTARRGVGEVAGEIEGAGGRINAFTSFDVTVYHATLPSDRLEVGLDVLADAVLHPAFDPAEIAREIEVVLEEIRRSQDTPAHVLGDAVLAALYRSHPYRAPILGTAESVAAFDRERVSAFYERWYAPEHLTVVATGDFEARKLLEQVRQAFAGRKPGSAQRARPAEPPQEGLRSAILARRFERARLELAWPAVALRHPDAAPLDLLAFVLGSGDSSRLVRRVREHDELADRIDASCYTPLDPGFFSVNVETDAARAEGAIEAAVREVERVRAEPVSGEELERARANFLASEHFERESVTGQATKLGSFQLTAGDYRAEERYLASVRAAAPADLLRVARTWLAPERLTAAALLPLAEASALDAARVAKAVGRGVERTARAVAAPSPQRAAPELVSYELPGGARLHVIPRRSVPVLAARAAFLGGLLAEDEARSGLSAFLTSMWLRGTRSHSAADFARASEGLAVEIDSFAGRSSLGLTLECPSDRLEPALDLLAEVLLEPAFDEEELEHERRETLAAIERREDQLGGRAFLLFAEAHYRRHPYRRPLLGMRASVSSFSTELVSAHHERLVRAGNLSFAIAGDVDPDRVAQRISSRLAELDAKPFEPLSVATEEAPREIRRAALAKEREQVHLVIGFRGVGVHDPDRHALEVIAQILAGQGGRLFLELRDRKSLAYSVSASNVEAFAPGYFATYIATAPEKLPDARAGLLRELERLLAAPPAEDELERARRYLTGNFAIDLQRNATHAAHVSLDALYGLGPDAYHAFPARIAAISAAEVQRVARRILDLGAYTEAVVGPQSALSPAP